MKASIILGVILGLTLLAIVGEPTAVAAGLAVSQQAATTQEPALMVLSGASLLALASVVRRYIP